MQRVQCSTVSNGLLLVGYAKGVRNFEDRVDFRPTPTKDMSAIWHHSCTNLLPLYSRLIIITINTWLLRFHDCTVSKVTKLAGLLELYNWLKWTNKHFSYQMVTYNLYDSLLYAIIWKARRFLVTVPSITTYFKFWIPSKMWSVKSYYHFTANRFHSLVSSVSFWIWTLFQYILLDIFIFFFHRRQSLSAVCSYLDSLSSQTLRTPARTTDWGILSFL